MKNKRMQKNIIINKNKGNQSSTVMAEKNKFISLERSFDNTNVY